MANFPNPETGQEKSQGQENVKKGKTTRSIIVIGEKALLLVLLAMGVFYFLPKISSLESSFNILASLKIWAIAFAFLAQLFSYYGSGLTISKCASLSGKKISVFTSMLIYTASTSVGLVAGGMLGSTASMFRWIKASGGDNESASLAASLPPVFIDIVLVLVSIIGLSFLLIVHDLTTSQITIFLLITFGLIIFCLFFIITVRHKRQATHILLKCASGLFMAFKREFPEEEFTGNIQHLFSTWDYLIRGGWRGPMLGSTLNILFDILTIYFVFQAAGISIPPIVLIAGYGLPWLFGRMAFIIPGGVGVVESTMVALYTSLGIENSPAAITVLTYRVISFWLPSIIGFLLLPFLNRNSERVDHLTH